MSVPYTNGRSLVDGAQELGLRTQIHSAVSET